MRRALIVVAALLPLTGCYVEPGSGYGYGQPGYQSPYGEDPDVYPGYSYNDGAPYLMVEGVPLALIYFGGVWGYYDGYGRFIHAPDRLSHHLYGRFPGGHGARVYTGGRPASGRVGGSQPPPRTEHRAPEYGGQGRAEPRYAPPARTEPAYAPHRPEPARSSPPPARSSPPPARNNPPPPSNHEEHRRNDEHRCPRGQDRC